MGRKKRGCPYLEPNCLECPFEECYATMHDINRQEAHWKEKELKKELQARNAAIMVDYKNHEPIKQIARKYNLSPSAIRKIISSLQ